MDELSNRIHLHSLTLSEKGNLISATKKAVKEGRPRNPQAMMLG